MSDHSAADSVGAAADSAVDLVDSVGAAVVSGDLAAVAAVEAALAVPGRLVVEWLVVDGLQGLIG